MLTFKQYLTEAKEGKNLHLEHLEDEVLNNGINELTVSYEKNAINIIEIINFINNQNIKISDISTDDGDLEDVFIRLTKN